VQDYEKLGVFYLGRLYDLDRAQAKKDYLLYNSKDLLTHAVCVGMTGSGKTGLCLTLLEEAAIDGIPAIVIDPKGDLTNLLLTFPNLSAEEFRPWVNDDDARRKEMSVEDFARAQAELWKKGLADWDMDGARIGRLKNAAEFAIYTPGSSAGRGVSVLRAFAAPERAILDDNELLHDRINSTVTGLLGLAGIDANPLQSREHILLATLLEKAWRAGQSLDLAALVQQTQKPPIAQVGVLDLESFFSAKERFALAMRLNNLLSAPGFAAWMQGEPLDVDALLHTSQGKPRISIFSIAHLDDAQRMFFVSLLLNETLAWMRAQPGATSLRALLYMDEIFGYFPPVANPPSKTPLLTLLKQARAFGLGIVLATQNPVDLDYKGLSNAGTWFLGRLQTERDKQRVLEGLEGASAGAGAELDRQRIEQVLSMLGNRVFLMNNVHESAPVVFQARWAMSYLRGPLSRDQIKRLTPAVEPTAASETLASAKTPSPATVPAPDKPTGVTSSQSAEATNVPVSATPDATAPAIAGYSATPPMLPPQVRSFYAPLRGERAEQKSLVYAPVALGLATVRFADKKLGIECVRPLCLLGTFSATNGAPDWAQAQRAELGEDELESTPVAQARFGVIPPDAATAKAAAGWKKSLADAIYRNEQLSLLKSPSVGEVSKPDENERAFRIRLQQAAREERDKLLEALRQKYAPKRDQLNDRIARAQATLEREKGDVSAKRIDTVISVGASVLDAIFGRRRSSLGRATTAARGAGRAAKEQGDVERAEAALDDLIAKRTALDEEVDLATKELQSRIDPLTEQLETVVVRAKKVDIEVRLTALAWLPQCVGADGKLRDVWK
jgi:hypothetical protein